MIFEKIKINWIFGIPPEQIIHNTFIQHNKQLHKMERKRWSQNLTYPKQ